MTRRLVWRVVSATPDDENRRSRWPPENVCYVLYGWFLFVSTTYLHLRSQHTSLCTLRFEYVTHIHTCKVNTPQTHHMVKLQNCNSTDSTADSTVAIVGSFGSFQRSQTSQTRDSKNFPPQAPQTWKLFLSNASARQQKLFCQPRYLSSRIDKDR